jgi:UDP-glucose:(heptosyl)LPS alpha-1,3-glucosyltransferase
MRKGLDTVIDALALAKNDAYRLVVAGRDRQQPAFEARARARGVQARVTFLGGQQEVRPLYAAADCFVLPSRYEPFGSTVLEALAMGLPAIVSSHCGAAEIIEPGVNGWVCEAGDTAGLARLMQSAASKRGEALSRAARATAERYGIDAMAGSLVKLYSALRT